MVPKADKVIRNWTMFVEWLLWHAWWWGNECPNSNMARVSNTWIHGHMINSCYVDVSKVGAVTLCTSCCCKWFVVVVSMRTGSCCSSLKRAKIWNLEIQSVGRRMTTTITMTNTHTENQQTKTTSTITTTKPDPKKNNNWKLNCFGSQTWFFAEIRKSLCDALRCRIHSLQICPGVWRIPGLVRNLTKSRLLHWSHNKTKKKTLSLRIKDKLHLE